MSYKSAKNYKDLAEPLHAPAMTRRDFIAAGMATGVMSVAVHNAFMGTMMSKAAAAELICPTPTSNPGGLAQIFAQGGPTMGARFFSKNQAEALNASANMARNYGVTGVAGNLEQIGTNVFVDKTSPFGFTLLAGPPGYVGGAAAWKRNVLNKVSGGGHMGPFNQDDGAGVNTGLIGGLSPFKVTKMGKDIKIGPTRTPAAWANGLPAATLDISKLNSAGLSKTFSLTPAVDGLTGKDQLNAASDAVNELQTAMAPVFKTDKRKGAEELKVSANCAFYNNAVIADPAFGTSLFTATGITDLTSKLNVGALTAQEQASLAAYYQSAKGVAGAITIEFNGRDYHGQSPQNVITPADVEEARAIVMFLAGCEAANAPGSMIYTSNGQAIANGVAATTATINGATANLNAPVAKGDAGGSYNAGLILFFSPTGSLPSSKFTGSIDSNGNAQSSPNVPSSAEAMAGLYLSAMSFIGNGQIPDKALKAMQSTGVAASPSKIMVI